MKQYNELTELGKKRRLNEVAQIALREYDIDAKSVSYLTEETNMFYKVVDFSGTKYALKIFEEESSKIEDNLAEIFLIDQVSKNSDIIVPKVVFAKDGRGVVTVSHKGFDIKKRVAIYEWIEGKEIDGREDDRYYFELGKITAKLHEATRDIVIPSEITPKKWDKIFYYRDEVAIYKEDRFQSYLPKGYHETMDFIIPYLDRELASYYDNTKPQLLHADLNPYNVWTHKGGYAVIDFEEAMYALPVHDFAISLFYYKYDDDFDYDKIKDLFFKGYADYRSLPEFTERDIELLMTARRVNFLNYGLLTIEDPKKYNGYAERNIARVKKFMKEFI